MFLLQKIEKLGKVRCGGIRPPHKFIVKRLIFGGYNELEFKRFHKNYCHVKHKFKIFLLYYVLNSITVFTSYYFNK